MSSEMLWISPSIARTWAIMRSASLICSHPELVPGRAVHVRGVDGGCGARDRGERDLDRVHDVDDGVDGVDGLLDRVEDPAQQRDRAVELGPEAADVDGDVGSTDQPAHDRHRRLDDEALEDVAEERDERPDPEGRRLGHLDQAARELADEVATLRVRRVVLAQRHHLGAEGVSRLPLPDVEGVGAERGEVLAHPGAHLARDAPAGLGLAHQPPVAAQRLDELVDGVDVERRPAEPEQVPDQEAAAGLELLDEVVTGRHGGRAHQRRRVDLLDDAHHVPPLSFVAHLMAPSFFGPASAWRTAFCWSSTSWSRSHVSCSPSASPTTAPGSCSTLVAVPNRPASLSVIAPAAGLREPRSSSRPGTWLRAQSWPFS